MREVYHSLFTRADDKRQRMAISDDRGAASFRDLALRVTAAAASLPKSVNTVAIVGRAGVSWIVADLAATLAGRRVVPVPSFFSSDQVGHVLSDSGAQRVLCCDLVEDCAARKALLDLHLPMQCVDGHAQVPESNGQRHPYAGGAERVIYTSGTTGTPKGVVHGDRQMSHAITAIGAAVVASADDVHLSCLPASSLLEQIAGVFIPLAVGGRVHVSAAAIEAAMSGDLYALLALFKRIEPTATVLVPQLLAAMTTAAQHCVWTPSASMRFAAVGGAPIPLALVRAARAVGIPVIRGYGLSECASVVAVERPGAPADDIDGGCGTALDGVHVDVRNGEIVVSGPTVMNGYLNADPRSDVPADESDGREWRTGDRGSLADDGTVVILGRCDRVLVLPSGRNVASDWLESIVLADVRYQAARVMLDKDGVLMLETVLRPDCADWLGPAQDAVVHARVHDLFASLPAYARPVRIRLVCRTESAEIAKEIELVHLPGAPASCDPVDNKETTLPRQRFYTRLLAETESAREEFMRIPIIVTALSGGVTRFQYLNYLAEAYHHVHHTCPLLGAALARCSKDDDAYRDALLEYIDEERGHDQWILNDIAALEGDVKSVRDAQGSDAVRIMVGYAYHVIERVSPYGLLGMVHVLEGMSVALAQQAAASIRQSFTDEQGQGFSYLTSHGALDQEHVVFFEKLVDGISNPVHERAIIDTARIMYRLFGDVFRALDAPGEDARNAA